MTCSDFCRGHKCSIPALARDVRVLTDMLIRFVSHLQANRRPLWLASDAILAMQTWGRTLKGQIKAAWDSVQSWKMMQPIKSRVPINHSILRAVAYASVMHATQLDRKNVLCWFSFSVCVRLGFTFCLDPKNSLTSQDVVCGYLRVM